LQKLGLEPKQRDTQEVIRSSRDQPAIARMLARDLDCAVLAMRFPVEDQFAIAFASTLYRQLLGNHAALPDSLRRAMRSAVHTGRSSPLAEVTPTLTGRHAVNLKFEAPRVPHSTFLVPETGLFRFPPEADRFVGRVAAMTSASSALAIKSCFSGVLFHGMVGAGKSACAIELAYHHRQTRRFKAWVWFKAADQGAIRRGRWWTWRSPWRRSFPNFR
jgi:hypothetical protein